MENKNYSNEGCGMCGGDCGQSCSTQCGGHGMRCDGRNERCQQMYGMRCGGRHLILRWILGIAILALVFGAGIKLGGFRESMMGGNYGYGMMGRNAGGYNMMQRGYNNTPDVYYYRGGMMQGLQGAINLQEQAPVR